MSDIIIHHTTIFPCKIISHQYSILQGKIVVWWMMMSLINYLFPFSCRFLFSIIIVQLIAALPLWCLCLLSMSINTEMDPQQQATSIEPVIDWRATWTLLVCPICNSRKSHEIKEVASAPMLFQWLKRMYCADCFCNWSICIQCSNVRKPILTERQQKRHHKSRHNSGKTRNFYSTLKLNLKLHLRS